MQDVKKTFQSVPVSTHPTLRLSPPQVLESVKLKQEVTQIEEERIQVLNNVEELEQKIKDLDNQMEESVREVGASEGGALRITSDVSTAARPYLAADDPATSGLPEGLVEPFSTLTP